MVAGLVKFFSFHPGLCFLFWVVCVFLFPEFDELNSELMNFPLGTCGCK